MHNMRICRGATALLLGIGLAGGGACSTETTPNDPTEGEEATSIITVSSTLFTFITDSIEIDVLEGGPGDANLVTGNDADGSASAQLPLGGPGDYIDWAQLDLANHRVPDLESVGGKDVSAFPHSDECVGPAKVLSKMDLTYVASANNTQFAYFAVQRSDNNGDAGYYWLFTRLTPERILGGGSCADDEEQLIYDITGRDPITLTGGDVLLKGHFKPSAEPLLEVYRATADSPNTPATAAIDFESPLWELDPDGVAAVAVNSTVTDPATFGSAGVKGLAGDYLDDEIFAEAAVPISVFTDGDLCGTTFYGSVITRSSGSGSVHPDLKDLAGPAEFNFGSTSVTAELRPTCGLAVEFEVTSAIGADGQPITAPECLWVFDDATERTVCSDTQPLAEGSHTGTVTVTDPASECSDTFTTGAVDVWPPVDVTASLTATCESSFDYLAIATGGSPAGVSYAWTFTGAGGGVATPTDPTAQSGSASVSIPGVEYTGEVKATDLRTDVADCHDTATATATPYAPIEVSLSLAGAAPICPAMNTELDDVTYDAVVTGGLGPSTYLYTWHGWSCSGDSCTIDPSDSNFCTGPINVSVTVGDSTGLCESRDSEEETYEKVTVVTATDE